MSQVQEALGAAFTIVYFEDADLTPEFYYYADDVKDGFERNPDEIIPPTQEVNDKYFGANVLLPPVNDRAQGRVRKRACDNDGNSIGRANEKPILDSREYVVEFKDGTEEELSNNAIAQIMYSQCDPDGNTYVLFDSVTDVRRSTTVL